MNQCVSSLLGYTSPLTVHVNININILKLPRSGDPTKMKKIPDVMSENNFICILTTSL